NITVDYAGTVVHQPLAPAQLWTNVTLRTGSNEDKVAPSPGDLIFPEGASVGRWIGSRRQGLRGVPVRVRTETIDAANSLQLLQGSYVTQQIRVVCIRTSAPIRWPRTFFASGDFVENDLTVEVGGQLVAFEASMDEVEPPFP